MKTAQVREPAVAGQFYPGQAGVLRETANRYVEEAGVEAAPDHVVALVCPHAGYMYSGPTAGYAYARAKGKKPRRVILLGCSHRYMFPGASVYEVGAFDTPLGRFPIDEAFAKTLSTRLETAPTGPHDMEHALEVQLPFLAVALGLMPIVPVLFGSPAGEWHAQAGRVIAELVEDGDLVIASTDLSHYLSEEEANQIDRRSIDAVLTKDWRVFNSGIGERSCSMCGASAVTAVMAYASARKADAWQLLDYRTSGRASGDYNHVVGYAALSMERAA